jgi:hypothetical protein
MSTIVHDCPRCGAKRITFEVCAELHVNTKYNWQKFYESFCVCRSCYRSTVFVIGFRDSQCERLFKNPDSIANFDGDITSLFEVEGYISRANLHSLDPPEHLPDDIRLAFEEGASCFAINCYNAAATMFRLCLDLATKPLLPSADEDGLAKPNEKERRDLGLRLQWLFRHKLLPEALVELAKCVREDANDGAHAGTLSRADAEDLIDFATAILERLITEPEKLRIAQQRRDERRKKAN